MAELSVESAAVVEEVVRRVEEQNRCADHRRRWESAFFQERLLRTLFNGFAVAALLFIVGAIVLWLINQELAGAGVTFIAGVVSGGVATFFKTAQSEADKREDEIWTAYAAACPDANEAKRELTGVSQQTTAGQT